MLSILIYIVSILVIQAASASVAANGTKDLECESHTLSVIKPLIDNLAAMSVKLEQLEIKDREISELKKVNDINLALLNELRSQNQFQMSTINKLVAHSSFNSTNQMQFEERAKKLQSCKDQDDKLDPNLLTSCIATEEYHTNFAAIRYLAGMDAFYVPCDYQLGNPGWLVIQKRLDGQLNFPQDWATYRQGFGHSNDGDFFLGLERIHRLTSSRCYELYVHLQFANGSMSYAHYDDFRVANEAQDYAMTVGSFTGNATDMLSAYNNVRFSTSDHSSGWWYGNYTRNNWDSNMLREAKLLIRPLEIK